MLSVRSRTCVVRRGGRAAEGTELRTQARGGGCALKKIGPGGVRPAPTPLERTAFYSRNVEAKEEDRRRRRVGHELQARLHARLHAQRRLVPIEGAQKEHARLRDRLEDF